MKVEFDRSFLKSLGKIKDENVLKQVEKQILKLEAAKSIKDIANLKKLAGFERYYRLRIGAYRLGMEFHSGDCLRCIVILHRKDIYKFFL